MQSCTFSSLHSHLSGELITLPSYSNQEACFRLKRLTPQNLGVTEILYLSPHILRVFKLLFYALASLNEQMDVGGNCPSISLQLYLLLLLLLPFSLL